MSNHIQLFAKAEEAALEHEKTLLGAEADTWGYVKEVWKQGWIFGYLAKTHEDPAMQVVLAVKKAAPADAEWYHKNTTAYLKFNGPQLMSWLTGAKKWVESPINPNVNEVDYIKLK